MLESLVLILPLTMFVNTNFLNYIVFCILLFQIYKIFKKRNLTLEDQYQIDLNKKNKSNGSLIYVTLEYDNEKYFNKVLENLENRLMEYNYIYNSNQDFDRINCSKSKFYYNRVSFIHEQDYHYKFYINIKKMRIYAYIKHEFIGGAYLLTLFYSFINTPQKSINELFPRSSFFNLLWCLKFLYNYNQIPKINDGDFLPLLNDKKVMKRYINNYKLSNIQSCSTKSVILFKILSILYKALKLNRPLVCYLPIAVQHYPEVKNNIGLMWLTFDINKDTPETISTQIYNNRYQVLATNFLLLYKNNKSESGTSVRKSVDVVISFMLATEKYCNFKASWTYEFISDYPVYVSIASIMKEDSIDITQTITSSTSQFDISFDDSFKETSLQDYMV